MTFYVSENEQRFLAEVTRQNGWTYVRGGYNSSDGRHRFVPDLYGVSLWSRPDTDARWTAEPAYAITVRQALDELVWRGLLPDRRAAMAPTTTTGGTR